ncbi:winged helix-turn-helix domain-containing protein [Streptomyces sp. NPDC001935]|uniref:response regulator transcription factor n=1 Tax=Streptomyces sp. NPDC056738 TaxID=3345933 RepID=UPI00367B6D44
MNVLIVEDDDGVADALREVLSGHGYQVHRVATGLEAMEHITSAQLVLLDLGLPDLDGHEVCRRIREHSCVPVITLSGRASEMDRVMALHMGADDFVAKPFSRYELLARMRAVLRRTTPCPQHPQAATAGPRSVPVPPDSPEPRSAAPRTVAGRETDRTAAPPPPMCAGPLRLDPRTRQVLLDGTEVRVTRREFDLLAMLIEEPGTVWEREEIMDRVWDENWFGSTRTLDVHVGSLRTKLGHKDWIETVRGVGYRLTVSATPEPCGESR